MRKSALRALTSSCAGIPSPSSHDDRSVDRLWRAPSEQIAGGAAAGAAQAMDVEQRHVALTALDRSDVDAVQVGAVGEVLLAEAPFAAELPDARAERAQRAALVVEGLWHPSTLRVAPVQDLQTMSSTSGFQQDGPCSYSGT